MRNRYQPIENPIQPQSAETVIGSSLKIEGELKSQSDIRVDGEVSGTITTKGDVYVGQQANVSASIQATNAFVSGRVTGDIAVTKQLTLEASARVKGNVTAGEIVITKGAQFNGQCTMTSAEAEAKAGEPKIAKQFSSPVLQKEMVTS